jgi:PBP1b-binding outer membrane lipoprotein LpoB
MTIRVFVLVATTLLLCGCHSLHTPTCREASENPEIPFADVDIEVEELPGLFQKVD